LAGCTLFECKKGMEEVPKRAACEITAFTVNGTAWDIDGTNITHTYPAETEEVSLTPTITLSPGATVNPSANEAQNFFTSQGVTYTVTAEDGVTKKIYTAKATRTPNINCDIISFSVDTVEWDIDGTNISHIYPAETKETSLTPTIILSPGATVNPSANEAQNFFTSQGVTYIVTAEDGITTKKYIVKATIEELFIRLISDKTEIKSDNSDAVRFTVLDQHNNVFPYATIYMLPFNESTGNVFKTYTPSVYRFYAKYNSTVSNTITIDAVSSIVIQPEVSKKHLSLISVVNSWSNYEANSWERGFIFKENEDIQIFEVCIWNIARPKVSLYQFDRTFNPDKDEYVLGGQSWVDHREQYNILDIELSSMNSTSVMEAFKQIVEKVIKTQPAKHYGLKYIGHGVGNSSLFEAKMNQSDATLFLSHFCNLLGRKIDFLDWNTNCGGGTFELVSGQYRFADYILASDINRGGYDFDVEDYFKYQHEQIIETFFSPFVSIRQSLINMINSERLFWETSKTKNDMISNSVMQSISIYDAAQFEPLAELFTNPESPVIYSGDVLDYIQHFYPSEQNKYFNFRFHYVHNKDFFQWSTNTNGFSIHLY
jgi:hypothetical protein